jgi:uncharacterized protein YndB with AHSA1/START domain
MRETLNVTRTIAIPSGEVWSAISAIGGLDRWFSVIASCRVEGAGVGATRILTLADGAEMRDRVLEIDHDARRFRYERTHSPFPVASHLGTVEVRDRDVLRAEVSWTVTLDVVPEAREQLVGILKDALSDGIGGLERDLR